MNKTILKSKSIKSEAFREYSRLQGYVTSSIALIQKALYYEVTPTFAKVKGQFINLKDQRSAEKKVSLSHLKDHSSRLRKLLDEHSA